jgi:hypothetical protein
MLTSGQHIYYLVSSQSLTENPRDWPRSPVAKRLDKSNVFIWLPPRDSNPDMLIQSYVNQGGRFRILSLS